MRPALGSMFFVLAGPLVETVAGPWALTGFRTHDGPGWLVAPGSALIAAGAAVLVLTYVRFVAGGGTPSPLAPPRRLVAAGPYRWVRHPQYVAAAAIIAGEALVLRRPVLLAAAVAYLAALAALSRFVEEPLLRRRFGADFDAYRNAVPGWLPRPPHGRRRAARRGGLRAK